MRLISYNPSVNSFDRVATWPELLESAFAVRNSRLSSAPRGLAVDVHEDAERITVSVEAAGFQREDFELSLHDGELTIAGERKPEARDGETLRRERAYGRFSRTLVLPAAVQADAVSATYEAGILTVVLPKSEEAKPRKIAVG